MKRQKTIALAGFTLATLVISSVSMADHSWRRYKWQPSSIPFNLDLGDNVNSAWDGHLIGASTDWSVSAVLGTTVVTGATNSASCSLDSGTVQVCNDAYGDNGWLGLAQISVVRGSTIVAGVAKLNDTYYNTTQYDTPAWRQMVMCQEIAHTFGLDHQDEVFNNVNLGTCMDYTDDPDGSIGGEMTNEYPNQHDFDQLESIYPLSDGGDGGGGGGGPGGDCNPKSPKCNPASAAGGHAQWGQLVSGHGSTEIYERSLGSGRKVITFITWTLEHAESHEH